MHTIKIYGIDMSGFEFDEAAKSFYHSDICPVEEKGVFNVGDKLVGIAKTSEISYLVYSCAGCGGMYTVEGEVSDKLVKGL